MVGVGIAWPYVVAPPPVREAYLHVGVGPGGDTLCRTRMYVTPVARPGVGANLTRPWHPVSYRLLYSLVARELWAGGEDQAVDRVHFELTSGGGGGAGDALSEESAKWAWVERSAWATVSITWYSLFTGEALVPNEGMPGIKRRSAWYQQEGMHGIKRRSAWYQTEADLPYGVPLAFIWAK